MFAPDNGGVVEELERTVLVFKRSIRAVPDASVVSDADCGNAPGNRVAAFEAGNPQFIHDVPLESQEGSNGVVETRVAEAGLGNHGGR